MFKTTGESSTSAPLRTQLLVAAVALVTGALIVAVAVGIIPSPESSFHAPHWVVGAAGMCFVLAGVSILAPALITGSCAPDGQTPGQQRAVKLVQQLLGCLMLTAFASIACWVGFGPGERHFSSSTSFLGVTSSGASSASLGRIVFGGMGALVALGAAFSWYALLRTLVKGSAADGQDR